MFFPPQRHPAFFSLSCCLFPQELKILPTEIPSSIFSDETLVHGLQQISQDLPYPPETACAPYLTYAASLLGSWNSCLDFGYFSSLVERAACQRISTLFHALSTLKFSLPTRVEGTSLVDGKNRALIFRMWALFLHPTREDQLASADSSFSHLPETRGSPLGRWRQQLTIFLLAPPLTFWEGSKDYK